MSSIGLRKYWVKNPSKRYRAPRDRELKKISRNEDRFIFQNLKKRVTRKILCEVDSLLGPPPPNISDIRVPRG